MKRTVIAVVVGFIGWTVIWLGGGAILQALMPDAYPTGESITNVTALALTLALSIVCSLTAGAIASKLGAASSGKAVMTLGIVLLLVGIGVQASMWSLMPIWYHLAFLALIVPVTLLGGRIVKPNPAMERAGMSMSKVA